MFCLFYLPYKVYFISLLGSVISGYIDKFAKSVPIFFFGMENHKTNFIAFFFARSSCWKLVFVGLSLTFPRGILKLWNILEVNQVLVWVVCNCKTFSRDLRGTRGENIWSVFKSLCNLLSSINSRIKKKWSILCAISESNQLKNYNNSRKYNKKKKLYKNPLTFYIYADSQRVVRVLNWI